MRKVDPWIQTFTGKRFDYSNITKDIICIEDIAHSLAQQCRYTGHTKEHYSVAQHSVLVSLILPDNLALSGLMHDAAEAYVHDINKPLKDFIGCKKLEVLEHDISVAIYDKFNIRPYHFDDEDIKKADLVLLRAESLQILADNPIDNWHEGLPTHDVIISELNWEIAEKSFLRRFYKLIQNR